MSALAARTDALGPTIAPCLSGTRANPAGGLVVRWYTCRKGRTHVGDDDVRDRKVKSNHADARHQKDSRVRVVHEALHGVSAAFYPHSAVEELDWYVACV